MCLYNDFILLEEPKIDLEFHKQSTITRIFSSFDYIKLKEAYSCKCETLGSNFDHKNCVAPHTKIGLNLEVAKSTSYLPRKMHWINITVISFSLVKKLSYKCKINVIYHYLHYIGQKVLSAVKII